MKSFRAAPSMSVVRCIRYKLIPYKGKVLGFIAQLKAQRSWNNRFLTSVCRCSCFTPVLQDLLKASILAKYFSWSGDDLNVWK